MCHLLNRADIVTELEIRNGYLVLPTDRVGLGVALNEEYLAPNLVESVGD